MDIVVLLCVFEIAFKAIVVAVTTVKVEFDDVRISNTVKAA